MKIDLSATLVARTITANYALARRGGKFTVSIMSGGRVLVGLASDYASNGESTPEQTRARNARTFNRVLTAKGWAVITDRTNVISDVDAAAQVAAIFAQ
jgi:hypothetical protein